MTLRSSYLISRETSLRSIGLHHGLAVIIFDFVCNRSNQQFVWASMGSHEVCLWVLHCVPPLWAIGHCYYIVLLHHYIATCGLLWCCIFTELTMSSTSLRAWCAWYSSIYPHSLPSEHHYHIIRSLGLHQIRSTSSLHPAQPHIWPRCLLLSSLSTSSIPTIVHHHLLPSSFYALQSSKRPSLLVLKC